jgi:16S rRNA (cytosine967-C5)-methyltransferase
MTSAMTESCLAMAAGVIARANRDHPADAVLRQELKRRPGLSRASGRQISLAVFAFYRWLRWLDPATPVPRQLPQALEMDRQFQLNPAGFSAADLRAKTVPDWIGAEMEIPEDWLRQLQYPPRVWLRARPGQGATLARSLGETRPAGPQKLADALEYQGAADLFRTPAFQAGEFELQDLGSQAVGWLCNPQPGEAWWDACAGEGGKMLHLSDLMENQGLIWATDRASWRLEQLRRRAARARVFNYRAKPWQGGVARPTKTRFDGVLVDAPCVGVGTWQRNPQARWTSRPEDVHELADRQRQLLRHVAPAVKPGGKLVYSVCSLTRAETTETALAFERACPEFRRLPLRHPFLAEPASRPEIWIWPQENQSNGMFIAAWKRI